MSAELTPAARGRTSERTVAVAVICMTAFVVITAVALTWAKWWPYSHKLGAMVGSHVYPGHSVLDAADGPGAAPSWHAAWDFAVTYGKAVWVALLAGLLVAAGVESLLPRAGIVRALRGGGRWGGSLVGGALSLPCMMCTCCTAPVTTSLRRSGAPTSSALAFWVGNPTLNPAVLAFLALVLPWQFVATRLAIGLVLVFGVTTLVARLARGDTGQVDDTDAVEPRPEPVQLRAVPGRYLRALARLSLVLVPEYAVVVLALGAFRGWLLPLGDSATTWGIGAVVVAAVAGTLLVIPTGGEIPIIAGLSADGFGLGVTGALLIALPALSLPSMVMVGRGLSWRVTGAMAGAVTVAALAGGGLLGVLG